MLDRFPVACSLDGDQARRRWQEWNALLGRRLSFDRSPRHITVRFAAGDNVLAQLQGLIAAEQQCCGFVAWEVEELGNAVLLAVRGDPDGVRAMSEAFGL
jgi:hypothetical protein